MSAIYAYTNIPFFSTYIYTINVDEEINVKFKQVKSEDAIAFSIYRLEYGNI